MSIFNYEEGALSKNYNYLNELGEEGHIRVALYAKKATDGSSTGDQRRHRAMFAIKEFPITRFHREYHRTPTQL
jgi:hypothetical protein